MRVVPRVSHNRTAMSNKVGKNEAKRLKAQALKEFQSETTEEERERILRRGMGVDLGGALQKGEEKVFEKKLTKEEKKAAMAAKRAELAERRAARKGLVRHTATTLAAAPAAALATLCRLASAAGGGGSGLLG